MCKHQHIITTAKTHYYFEEGYNKVMEKDDVDLAEYETGNFENITQCQDCGKVLEDTYF